MLTTGYVLFLPADRREAFENAIESWGTFAEPVPDFGNAQSGSIVGFISALPGQITHLGRGRKGQRAGTGLSRLNLRDVILLEPPLQIEALTVNLSASTRLIGILRRGGYLPATSLRELIEIILEIEPGFKPLLDSFSDQEDRIQGLGETARTSLALQKDAVGVALEIAGVDRVSLEDWSRPAGPEATSFLDGLPEVRTREDQMILH